MCWLVNDLVDWTAPPVKVEQFFFVRHKDFQEYSKNFQEYRPVPILKTPNFAAKFNKHAGCYGKCYIQLSNRRYT